MTRDYLAIVGTDGNIGGPGGSPISPSLTGFALAAAEVVSTSNLALTGLQTVDGYTLQNADRILLTGQTTQSQNGVWSASASTWTRPTDFASGAVFTGSRTVQIINGKVNGRSTWLLATNNVTVDTTAQVWQYQLNAFIVAAGRLVVLPAPSGGDDAAIVNPIIAAAGAGSKVIAAPGTYMMNSAPLTLYGGIDYDFTLATFTSLQGSGHPIVTNLAALSSSINAASPFATDVGTTGVTYEVDSLATSGTPTGGTFTMKFTWNSVVWTSASIAWNAASSAVQTALQNSTGPYGQHLPSASVTCSGGALPTAVTVTFGVQLVGPVTNFLISTNSLTGGSTPSAAATRTTDGALGSSTITSSTLAGSAVVGQTVQVVGAGPNPNPPNLTAKVTSVTGTHVILGNDYGAVAASQTLSNASAYLITRDQDIVVRGGRFVRTDTSGNGSANPTAAYFSGACGVFRHVDRLTFKDFSITMTPDHQTWNTADCTDYTYSNVKLNNVGDGLHFGGCSFRGTVDNVTGTTGDDFIAALGRDFGYAEDCAGDVRSLYCSNIKQTAGAGFDLIAGAGCTMADVTVNGFYGLCSQAAGTYPVRLADATNDYPQCGGGTLDDIVFRDIRPVVTGYGAGMVAVTTLGVKNLTIDGLHSSSPSGTNPSAILSLNANGLGIPSNIERLTVRNMIVEQMPASTTPAIGVSSCNVGKMTLTGSRFVLSAAQYVIQVGSTGSVNNLIVSDTTAENLSPPGGSLVSMSSSGSIVPTMKVSNFDGNGLANLVDTGSTTAVTVNVANVNLTSVTEACLVRTGATLRIQGGSCYTSNPLVISGTASVDCPTLATDVTVLTPTVGDRVFNTNLTLPAGAKPVIYDDGSGSVTGTQQYSNGGFESGVTNFTGSNGNSVTGITSPVHSGSHAAQVTCAGTNIVNFFRNVGTPHDGAVITPGLLYQAQAWLRTAVTSRNWSFVVEWYNSGGTLISSVNQLGVSTTDVTGVWEPLTFTTTAPALAAQYQLQLRTSTTPANGEIHYIDDITFYQVQTPVWRPAKTPYFAAGSVALVAGTATVFQALVTANSYVRCFTQTPGGTAGALSVTVSTGQMVFTSTSNTDTSTIYWELATP